MDHARRYWLVFASREAVRHTTSDHEYTSSAAYICHIMVWSYSPVKNSTEQAEWMEGIVY